MSGFFFYPMMDVLTLPKIFLIASQSVDAKKGSAEAGARGILLDIFKARLKYDRIQSPTCGIGAVT
jgi:hypothetical protein